MDVIAVIVVVVFGMAGILSKFPERPFRDRGKVVVYLDFIPGSVVSEALTKRS